MKALIDLDIVIWRCAAASKEEEPINWLFQSLNQTMRRILVKTNADSYAGYLSGADNFRKRIAKTKTYKGNRPDEKPSKYYYAREYLIQHWGAKVVHFIEADDQLGIDQTEELLHDEEGNVKECNSVICSIDKDLLQIEGWHYNFVKDEWAFVDKEEAERFLWKQVLVGDSTDNIPGIPGIGDKKAEKILDATANPYETSVFLEYEGYVANKVVPEEEQGNLELISQEAERLMNETFDLVYILRYQEEADDRAQQMIAAMGKEAAEMYGEEDTTTS